MSTPERYVWTEYGLADAEAMGIEPYEAIQAAEASHRCRWHLAEGTWAHVASSLAGRFLKLIITAVDDEDTSWAIEGVVPAIPDEIALYRKQGDDNADT